MEGCSKIGLQPRETETGERERQPALVTIPYLGDGGLASTPTARRVIFSPAVIPVLHHGS